ncbi:MAG: hypothetical protein NXH75_07685 [Halobacteriovoraceae bacterium]|nr:hypothetical protein [Halobacteriovoraceae bacterium]
MPLKSLIKNPMFAIGLLFTIIFLFQVGEKYSWWPSRRQKLMPSSCKAVRVKLDRRIPANWSSACEGKDFNSLAVEINYPEDKGKDVKDEKKLRKLIYRELANNLIQIAKNSPADNLERTQMVRVRFRHPQIQVDALTEGKYLVKLQTLTNKQLIAQHLKVTVQVKESPLK